MVFTQKRPLRAGDVVVSKESEALVRAMAQELARPCDTSVLSRCLVVHFTLHTAHCTLPTVHCTVHCVAISPRIVVVHKAMFAKPCSQSHGALG